jgi:hypothetical protein
VRLARKEQRVTQAPLGRPVQPAPLAP